jgi:hypothetical protein
MASTRRRTLLRGALSGAFVAWLTETRAAKKKPRCKPNGAKCAKKSPECKSANCLRPSFTIRAKWANTESDHDTYFFVPNQKGSSDPFPLIVYTCNSDETNDGALYPFAFVSQDAAGPGDEVTTVRKLLKGTYEYWIEVDSEVAAGDLEVILRNKDGKLVRSWSSPANPSADQRGWHVFDINGKTGSVDSIDTLVAGDLPDGAHDQHTDVCPD